MSNNFIKHITLENYKSIKKLDLELKPLNVLIGSNGAGKSNFISFFNLLVKSINRAGDTHIIKNGGMDYFLHYGSKISQFVRAKIKTSVNFGIELIIHRNIDSTPLIEFLFLDKDNNSLKSITRAIHSINTISQLDNNINDNNLILYGIQSFHFNDTSDTSPLKSRVPNNDNLFLRADGQNLSCMIKLIYDKYPEYYYMIVDTIRNVVPDFHDFVIRQNDEYLELEWFNKNNVDIPWKAHYLSDGSLRFIALAVLLLMPSELQPEVIIIDEPEIGLHPTALNVLSGLIKRASLERQVIISTQSASLLSQFEPDDVIVVDKKDKASEFRRLKNDELETWLKDYTLGELWQTNVIGGRP